MEKHWELGKDEDSLLSAISSLSRREGCGHRGSPLWGLPVPGETTWPASLQTWAHVASDKQELFLMLVTSAGFLLPAPSGKQTVIFLSDTAVWSC